MSSNVKIPFDQALFAGLTFIEQVSPGCERIEIAGSLRRGRPEVGDIEIVAIPKTKPILDLFGQPAGETSLLDPLLDGFRILRGGDKYKKIQLPGVEIVDLFIVTPATWGVIYTIRTGSADFSKWLVTPRQKGGALPSHLVVKDGRVWSGDVPLNTAEEGDFFQVLGLEFVKPERRIAGFWHR